MCVCDSFLQGPHGPKGPKGPKGEWGLAAAGKQNSKAAANALRSLDVHRSFNNVLGQGVPPHSILGGACVNGSGIAAAAACQLAVKDLQASMLV